MSDAPYLLPRPEVRPSRDEVNQALAMGLVPLVVQNDQLVPIWDERHKIGLLFDSYRQHLLQKISNGESSWDSPVERSLIWGYQALHAEYEARDELSSISKTYRAAASSANELRLAFESDGRLLDGIPLRIAIEHNIQACDYHAKMVDEARKDKTTIVGLAIDDFVWHKWMDRLYNDNVWEVLEHNGKRLDVYRLDKMSMANLVHVGHVFRVAADLADAVQAEVRRTTPRSSRQGGHPIDYPRRWLILEARRQGMDVAALGKLLYERRNDLADFRGLGKATLTKRIKEAWRRVPQSDPSLQAPTVAHNL